MRGTASLDTAGRRRSDKHAFMARIDAFIMQKHGGPRVSEVSGIERVICIIQVVKIIYTAKIAGGGIPISNSPPGRRVGAVRNIGEIALPGAPRVGFTRGCFEISICFRSRMKPSSLPRIVDELPDSPEMMIVVFGDKIQMIHEPHRRLQTRVENGSSK